MGGLLLAIFIVGSAILYIRSRGIGIGLPPGPPHEGK